ncbi:hypothetical protein [Azospirillum sp. B506]|nr:hypothetical protein [Azospirillum sp. B506]
MFDFDVVTGPTQPPHCSLADEHAGPAAAESALPPVDPALLAAGTPSESPMTKGEKQRS